MQITTANVTDAFNKKPSATQELINQALSILNALGVPLHNLKWVPMMTFAEKISCLLLRLVLSSKQAQTPQEIILCADMP